MRANDRTEDLAKRLGFTIGRHYMTRDVRPVSYKGIMLFNVPTVVYAMNKEMYKPEGISQRHYSYHELIPKFRFFWTRINTTMWFKDLYLEAANQKFNPQEYAPES